MAIKKDTFIRKIKGITHIVYPEHIKKEIVAELESGQISIKEAMDKYEIHQLLTIKNWLKKYSNLDKSSYQRARTSPSLRRQAVREIESGKLSYAEASQKYHVGEDTLKKWIKLYSCSLINPQQEMESNKLPALAQDQATLIRTIAELKLKIAGLETMIDIAEKDLKVDIRKKSGTKQ
jgi:transposase-like protein